MSHIVRGTIQVAYADQQLLVRAIHEIGLIQRDAPLYEVGAGYTSQTFPIVLVDIKDSKRRIGFRERSGVWHQYQEEFGSYGEWTRRTSSALQDLYLAFHYEQQLTKEGFNVEMRRMSDGGLKMVAEEVTW